ncbi:MAG: hypothetical protein Q8P60_10410 [Pseudorhodobacter sp.]|nr:hypothetical protein [Pseudorhodobacter sp.]
MSIRLSSAFVAMLGAVVALPAFAEDLVFTLSNRTTSDLTEFYASPVGVDNWEEDILGDQSLAAGASGEVTISDSRSNCEYDLRMVFADGDVLEDTADLCDTGSYTIN